MHLTEYLYAQRAGDQIAFFTLKNRFDFHANESKLVIRFIILILYTTKVNSLKRLAGWKISAGLDYLIVEFSGLPCVLELWVSERKLYVIVIGLSFVNCEKQNYEDNTFAVTFFRLFISSWMDLDGFKDAKLSNGAIMPLIGLG